MKEHNWHADIGVTNSGFDGVYCVDCDEKMNTDIEEIVPGECSNRVNRSEFHYEYFSNNNAGGYRALAVRL